MCTVDFPVIRERFKLLFVQKVEACGLFSAFFLFFQLIGNGKLRATAIV